MAFKTRLNTYTDGVDTQTGSEVAADLDQLLQECIKAEFQEDISTNLTAMQATRDPYPGAVESLATNREEDLQSLRYLLGQLKDAGATDYYKDVLSSVHELFAGDQKLVSKTGAYTATTSDGVILCDASSAGFAITLPAVSGNTGKRYWIKKTDSSSNVVTVDGNGSELIDGVIIRHLRYQNEGIGIICDGTGWVIIQSRGHQFSKQLGYRGLVCVQNSATPLSQSDLDADYVDVEDTSFNRVRLYNVNLTGNITVTGANGRDTGTETASKVYAKWVIWNPTTETAALLYSLSFTSPTMPSGYTYKSRWGFVVNDASSNFIPFYQQGAEYLFDDPIDDTKVLNAGTATSWTNIDCSAFAPGSPFCRSALFGVDAATTTDTSSFYVMIRPSTSSGGGKRVVRLRKDSTGGNYGQYQAAEFKIMLSSGAIFQYDVTSGITVYMWLHGVMLNI